MEHPIGRATPHAELIRQLMSESGYKTDREWAAKREIERLQIVATAAMEWADLVDIKRNEPAKDLVERLDRADAILSKAVQEYRAHLSAIR